MNLLFKQGQTITVNGINLVIGIAKKNYSTGLISYRLSDGKLVSQEMLTKMIDLPAPSKPTIKQVQESELQLVKKRYIELFKKGISPRYRNDIEWLREQIRIKEQKDGNLKKLEALQQLDFDQLQQFVKEKALPINLDDFSDKDDLFQAICEEYNIQ